MDKDLINRLINQGIKVSNMLTEKYHYSSNLTHLLYLIIPAFIIKYGIQYEHQIIRSFQEIPILISDQKETVYQAYYRSIPFLNGNQYLTKKAIVLKNYQNIGLMQLLDNLVHEFNHAINSIQQELRETDDKLFVRTGLTSIIYDKKDLQVIGKEDNSILEEIINTKQTEKIIDIINSFRQYEIDNSEVNNTLYSIHTSIETHYQSNAYLLQSLICQELMENKTFISTLENLRFKGNVSDIETWFDTITGLQHSYQNLILYLRKTLHLQMEINQKQGIQFFKISKIKKLNQEAMRIVHLFNQNCNYR